MSAYPNSTIVEPQRDASMVARIAMGEQLVSSEIALELCKMVVINLRGKDEYEAQLPLSVEDGSNVWKVHGSRELKDETFPLGPICMSISKLDAAIVSFTE
jgi:hypothetical protein